GFDVRLEAVVARDRRHFASRARRRDSEPIALALDDERRHSHRLEFGEAALRRLTAAARWLEREREAEHADGARRFRGAACDAAAHRTTADDERQVSQVARAQVIDDRNPRGVE